MAEAPMPTPAPTPWPDSVLRVAQALRDAGHAQAPRWLDVAARTSQQAADALGVQVGQIAKSVIFRRVVMGGMVVGRMIMVRVAMARVFFRLCFNGLCFNGLCAGAALTIRAARSAFGGVGIQNLKRAGGLFVRCHEDLPIF